MTKTENIDQEEDRMDEAIRWHVRLNSGDAREEDWVAFTSWLEADGKNQAAYTEVEILWATLDERQPEITRAAGMAPASQPSNLLPFKAPVARSWRVAFTAVAASLLVMVAVRFLWPFGPEVEHYQTGIGQTRLVSLADGSTVRLNTGTEISVAMDRSTRQLTLDHGEALFEVAKDPARPFYVRVADQQIRVVGTIFNILRSDNIVTVTVARGIVAVAPVNQGNGETKRLVAGDQLIHHEGAPVSEVRKVEAYKILAWQHGRLIYDNAPLTEVVRDLNRYFETPIRIEGASTAELKFSGVLMIDTEAAVLKRLEAYLPVVASTSNNIVMLHLRREQK